MGPNLADIWSLIFIYYENIKIFKNNIFNIFEYVDVSRKTSIFELTILIDVRFDGVILLPGFYGHEVHFVAQKCLQTLAVIPSLGPGQLLTSI